MSRILIIDDDEVIRMLYAEELTQDGYEVISTSDCSALTTTITEFRPDVILLDIRMGQYDGLEVLQDIRKAFYNLPVILCTAYSTFKYDLKSIAADYYVVKSADLEELKLTISMALEGTSCPVQEKEGKQTNNEHESGDPPSVLLG
jgi:DNA-binding NtrC family response regulator